MVAALTAQKCLQNDDHRNVCHGIPTFILATGTSLWAVFGYLIIMTIGEAMWQPRFLQWVADIAPKE